MSSSTLYCCSGESPGMVKLTGNMKLFPPNETNSLNPHDLLKDVCQPYDLMWMNHRDVFGIFKNVFVIILFDVCWSSCYIENILEYVSGTSVACIAFDLAARVYK